MIDANLLEERVLEMMVGQAQGQPGRIFARPNRIGSAGGAYVAVLAMYATFLFATRTDVASSLMLNAQCPGRSIITARTIFTFRPGTAHSPRFAGLGVRRHAAALPSAPYSWRLNLRPLPPGQLAARRREHAPALQGRFATVNGRVAQFGVVDMNLETKASLRQPRGIRFAIESPKPPEGAKDEGQDESINLH